LILEIVLSQGDGLGETQAVVLAGLVKLLSTGLVGGMSASGGKEVGASVLDAVVRKLDQETTRQQDGEEGKKRLNLIGFLAEMYNLQVVAAGLVFDIVKELIGNGLKEGDVEALLRILRQSGPQLRHDDPTALKQIIQLIQEQQKGLGTADQR
jgi:nucleolar MIF4G domain-containing protein 1